ncbi:MAG: nucleoside triphosphate pyrophosphohydrolase [Candidatus Saccharimonas sp.]
MTERPVTFGLNKLVRDKLPDMMRELGQEPEVTRLETKAHVRELIAKVIEEAQELDPNDPKYLNELADLKQVISDLIELSGVPDEVERLRQEDLAKRGGFLTGQYIGALHLPHDDPWIGYYRKDPKRFPEIESETKQQ